MESIQETAKEWFTKNGVTFSYQFIPQSFSRNAGKGKSLNWIVKIARGDKSFSTDYMQGVAHIPGYSMWGSTVDDVERRARMESATELGTYPDKNGLGMRKPLPNPDDAGVMWSLLLDMSGVKESFETWCMEYGYDTDSLKAFKLYGECQDIAVKISNMFTPTELAELREILRDY